MSFLWLCESVRFGVVFYGRLYISFEFNLACGCYIYLYSFVAVWAYYLMSLFMFHYLNNPLKKLPTPDYLKNMTSMFNRFNRSEEEGAFIADTDKPCGRCGKIKELTEKDVESPNGMAADC